MPPPEENTPPEPIEPPIPPVVQPLIQPSTSRLGWLKRKKVIAGIIVLLIVVGLVGFLLMKPNNSVAKVDSGGTDTEQSKSVTGQSTQGGVSPASPNTSPGSPSPTSPSPTTTPPTTPGSQPTPTPPGPSPTPTPTPTPPASSACGNTKIPEAACTTLLSIEKNGLTTDNSQLSNPASLPAGSTVSFAMSSWSTYSNTLGAVDGSVTYLGQSHPGTMTLSVINGKWKATNYTASY